MHPRRRIAAVGAAVAVALAAAPTALANDFERVYDDFKKTGTVRPCKFSDKQLDNAAKQTPPDIEQYVPSFLDALEAARERREECRSGAQAQQAQPAPAPAGAAPAPPAGGAPAPAAPAPGTAAPPPAPDPLPAEPKLTGVPSPPGAAAAKERESGTPAPVWILAALGALAALAALAGGIAWWLGLSPAWLTSLRSSFADAGERFADFGLEFADWVRTGR